jgi:hypothetical protein
MSVPSSSFSSFSKMPRILQSKEKSSFIYGREFF